MLGFVHAHIGNTSVKNIETNTEIQKKTVPKFVHFLFAGLSGMMAICFTHPADVIKMRLQIAKAGSKENFRDIYKSVIKQSGYRGLYHGISAALFRQITYTTGRVGFFTAVHDWYHETYGVEPRYSTMVLMGFCAGGVGAVLGNPAEVALIRIVSDAAKPPEKRLYNYNNVFHAFSRMIRDEGLKSLWRGCSSTVMRATLINGIQLSTYKQARRHLRPILGESPKLHLISAAISSSVAVIICTPIDNIKTKAQHSRGQTSFFRVVKRVLRTQGPQAFWYGMVPMFMKTGPHNILFFLFMEEMQILYRRYHDIPSLSSQNPGNTTKSCH